MLRILYLGNFSVDFTTESHIRKTLLDLGHEVVRLQEDNTSLSSILKMADDLQADLFLWTRTPGYFRDSGFELLTRLEEKGIPTASYHLDLYMGISREKEVPHDPFWKSNYCFSPDGDPESIEKFKALGINHFYLKPGVYKEECYMAEPDRNRFPHDIVFVGSRHYHSEYPYRNELITFLENTYGSRFMRYPMDGQGHIRGHELNTLYASVKIAVGDSLVKDFTHKFYWSDRCYEAPGRGAFQIFPYIDGLYEEFEEGNTIATYKLGDFEDLQFKINHFLECEQDREDIRLSCHQFVKRNCTYHNRMTQMLNVLGEHEPNIKENL